MSRADDLRAVRFTLGDHPTLTIPLCTGGCVCLRLDAGELEWTGAVGEYRVTERGIAALEAALMVEEEVKP